MRTNTISNILKSRSVKLYVNFKNNCVVIRQMLNKYKKEYPNIADYSILHYMDIIDICELIMEREIIDSFNADECYCSLMAALFVYTGLGINQKEWELFLPSLKLDNDTLTKNETVRLHYAYFSSCLLDHVSDMLELPSESHRNCIKTLILAMGREEKYDDSAIEDVPLDNGNIIRMTYLTGILALANELSELQNRNTDLSFNDFSKYQSEEILGFVERLSTSSFRREGSILVVEVRGSDTVFSLMQRKIDHLQKMINEFSAHISAKTDLKFSIRSIALRGLAEPHYNQNIYLNEDIEASWTTDDKLFYQMFSPEEKLFYISYLSSEYSVTSFLKEFAEQNHAELSGLKYRVKSPSSIYMKLHKTNADRTLETIADVIRYTVILSSERYTNDIKRILSALEERGWQVYGLENYWLKELPYNGVNSNLRNQSNIRAEIQFHTPESYKVKMSEEDHELYERRRVLKKDSPEYNEILAKQFDLYSKMPVPDNISQLHDI